MAKVVKLSDNLVSDAAAHGKVAHRTPPKQIEYWAKIGKVAEENPDLPLSFMLDILTSVRESDVNDVSEYQFE